MTSFDEMAYNDPVGAAQCRDAGRFDGHAYAAQDEDERLDRAEPRDRSTDPHETITTIAPSGLSTFRVTCKCGAEWLADSMDEVLATVATHRVDAEVT